MRQCVYTFCEKLSFRPILLTCDGLKCVSTCRAGHKKLSCSKFKMLVAKLVKKLELLTALKQDLSHNWLLVSQKNATMRQLPSPAHVFHPFETIALTKAISILYFMLLCFDWATCVILVVGRSKMVLLSMLSTTKNQVHLHLVYSVQKSSYGFSAQVLKVFKFSNPDLN